MLKEAGVKELLCISLEKFSLNFSSSSFGMRVNLLHPCSFMVYYYLLGFFYLSKLLFSGLLQFKSSFARGRNNSKYRD